LSQPGQTKSKELKIVSKQVITQDAVKGDKRKIQLLYFLKSVGGASEKALVSALYELKEKGIDLGYQFNIIGSNIFSPMIKEDLTTLLYLGLIENDVQSKKLKLTNNGIEFLESQQMDEDFKNQLASVLNDIKMKIQAIDEENRLKMRRKR